MFMQYKFVMRDKFLMQKLLSVIVMVFFSWIAAPLMLHRPTTLAPAPATQQVHQQLEAEQFLGMYNNQPQLHQPQLQYFQLPNGQVYAAMPIFVDEQVQHGEMLNTTRFLLPMEHQEAARDFLQLHGIVGGPQQQQVAVGRTFGGSSASTHGASGGPREEELQQSQISTRSTTSPRAVPISEEELKRRIQACFLSVHEQQILSYEKTVSLW